MPVTIHRLMSKIPAFYVSVLCDVFRAAGEEAEQNPTKEKRDRSRLAYELLSSFKVLPGQVDGAIDTSELREWIKSVREISSEKDRKIIGDQYIGHLLAHAETDKADGAWPDRAIRDLIEDMASVEVERGLASERFNMRGAYTKAMYEGGKQERNLAAQYQSWADAAAAWPRTSKMLGEISENWKKYAEAEDVRAAQDALRDR